MSSNIPEPLKSILSDYCHVEWAEEINELPEDMNDSEWPYDRDIFKSQLKASISNPQFSLEDYENATGEDFDDQQGMIDRLKEIWRMAFPNENI